MGDVPDRGPCGDRERTQVLKQKILEPIREEVRRRTSPDPVTVEEQDLRIQACPPSGEFDFVIQRAEYDATRDVTVFYLASTQRGSVPPLLVTVNKQRSIKVLVVKRDLRSGQAVGVNDLVESTQSSGNLLVRAAALLPALPDSVSSDSATRLAPKRKPNAALLVKVGMPSVLLVQGRNFRGSMTVVPLDSGRLGDEVRVRDPGTQNILRATVTDKNQLEEIF
jgi:flagella basal body P-ring formation protein FlgA